MTQRYIEGCFSSFDRLTHCREDGTPVFIPKSAFREELFTDPQTRLVLDHRAESLDVIASPPDLRIWVTNEGAFFSLKIDRNNWRHRQAAAMVKQGRHQASWKWGGSSRLKTDDSGSTVLCFDRIDAIEDITICASGANSGTWSHLVYNSSAPAVRPRAVAKTSRAKTAAAAAKKTPVKPCNHPRKASGVWDGPRPQIDISEQQTQFDIVDTWQRIKANRAGRLHVSARCYRQAGSSRDDISPLLTPEVMTRVERAQQAKQPPKRTPQKSQQTQPWVSPDSIR